MAQTFPDMEDFKDKSDFRTADSTFNPVELLRDSGNSKSSAVEKIEQTFGALSIGPIFLASRDNVGGDAELQKLLINDKSADPKSVEKLLELSKTNPELFRKGMELWKNGDRTRVEAIVRDFNDTEQLSTLFNLCADSKNGRAIDAMTANSVLAPLLLEQLASPVEADKTQAEKLLQWMNGTEEKQTDAFRVLNFVSARNQRDNLIKLLESPDTAAGTRAVLKQYAEAPDGRHHYNAQQLVDFISRDQDKGTEKQMVAYLSLVTGSESEQLLARRLAKSGDPDYQKEVLSLLSSPETRKAGLALSDLDILPLKDRDPALYEKTLEKVASLSPEKLQELQKVLQTLRHEASSHKLLEIFNDYNKIELFSKVTNQLLEGSHEDARAARRLLLSESGTPDTPEAEENKFRPGRKEPAPHAKLLEQMYVDPKQHELAKLILQQNDLNEQAILTQTLGDPANAALANDVSKLLKDDPEIARALVANLNTPEQMRKFIDIYNDKNQATAATVLGNLLIANRGADRLLSMLTSTNPKEVQLGNNVLGMVNTTADGRALNPRLDRSRLGWSGVTEARRNGTMLIESGLPFQQMSLLDQALNDDARKVDAQALLMASASRKEIRPQFSRIVSDYYSADQQRVGRALEVLTSLHKNRSQTTELLKLTNTGVPDVYEAFRAAQTPAELNAVIELLRMRESPLRSEEGDGPPPAQPKIASKAILNMLADPKTEASAKRLIKDLANPDTQVRTRRLIDAASRGGEAGTAKMIDALYSPQSEAQKTLSTEMTKLVDGISGPGSLQALENLASLLGTEEGQALQSTVALLQNPATRDATMKALRTFTSSEACAGLFEMMRTDNMKRAVDSLQDMMNTATGLELNRVQGLLQQYHNGTPQSRWLVGLLNGPSKPGDEDHSAFARSMIKTTTEQAALFRVRQLWKNPPEREKLQDLISRAKDDPTLSSHTESLLRQQNLDFTKFHVLLTSKEDGDLARQILILGDSGDLEERILGEQVGNMLSGTPPITSEFARQILEQHNATGDKIETNVLLYIAGLEPAKAKALFDRLSGPNKETARQFFDDHLTTDSLLQYTEHRAQVDGLLDLQDQTKVEDIWRRINDPNQRRRALQELEALRPKPPEFKKGKPK